MWHSCIILSILLGCALRCSTFTLNPEFQGWVGCISHHEVKPILAQKKLAAKEPVQLQCSIDLGMTETTLLLDKEGVSLNGVDRLATWKELEKIAKRGTGCHALYDDGSSPWKISTISESTSIPGSLCPPLQKSGAPTMVLGGFTMHRIAGDDVDPMVDTRNKLASIKIHPNMRVLDTCMGLGYTAVGAARLVGQGGGSVTTIEFDEASLEMCAFNPWSQQLFDQTVPVEILLGDSCDLITGFADATFDCVIHDPPARALCKSDLYGQQFYNQLFRVLKPRGQMFHYIGNPDSKESGRLY
ncbi:S-adenosyl-L-methionine-dependent methyltransferase, partial [Ochromonadaceae sp. CCMP2298]